MKRNFVSFSKITLYYASAIFAIIILISYLWHTFAFADVAILNPTSCLGGWLNPHNAEGKPDVTDIDNLSAYNAGNSAILSANAIADIFCGGFKSDVTPGSEPKSITLIVSWGIAQPVVPTLAGDQPAIESADTSTTSTEIENDAVGNPVPAPTPDSTDNQPTSFLNLFQPAFADEIAAGDDATATTDSTMTTSTSEVSNSDVTNSSSTVLMVDTSPASNQTENPFVEIDYTFDGVNWQKLATTDEFRLHYSNKFSVPLPEGSTWADISNMQIKISSIPRIDQTPTLYLDGMSLQVEYDKLRKTDFISKSGFYFDKISNASSTLSAQERNNDDREEELVVSSRSDVLGNIAIYNKDTGQLSLNTHVENNKYILQPAYFGVGSYSLLMTNDVDQCVGKTLDQCKSSPDFQSEVDFGVVTADYLTVEISSSTGEIYSEEPVTATQ